MKSKILIILYYIIYVLDKMLLILSRGNIPSFKNWINDTYDQKYKTNSLIRVSTSIVTILIYLILK